MTARADADAGRAPGDGTAPSRRFRGPGGRWTIRGILTLVGCATGLVVWLVMTTRGFNPVDAKDFFVDPSAPYTHPGYLYSPVAADVFGLLSTVGFPVFVAIIRAGETLSLVWFAGPVTPIAVLLPPVAAELNAANINLLLMVCVVLGFRWPALWAPVLLTKPTMGIGLLWFAWRREWRSLALALGPTVLIVAVSVLLQPGTWIDYARAMIAVPKDSGWPFPWPVWERAIVFVPILLWSIRTERRWGVILAVILAAPRLYFLSPVMLLAILRAPGVAGGHRRERVLGDGARVESAGHSSARRIVALARPGPRNA